MFQRKEALEYLLVYGKHWELQTAAPNTSFRWNLSGVLWSAYYRAIMFDHDALILDNNQIDWVGIGYPDGTPYITMECKGFTNFGIWSSRSALCMSGADGWEDVMIMVSRKKFLRSRM